MLLEETHLYFENSPPKVQYQIRVFGLEHQTVCTVLDNEKTNTCDELRREGHMLTFDFYIQIVNTKAELDRSTLIENFST